MEFTTFQIIILVLHCISIYGLILIALDLIFKDKSRILNSRLFTMFVLITTTSAIILTIIEEVLLKGARVVILA